MGKSHAGHGSLPLRAVLSLYATCVGHIYMLRVIVPLAPAKMVPKEWPVRSANEPEDRTGINILESYSYRVGTTELRAGDIELRDRR
jgi:hypothetical protein